MQTLYVLYIYMHHTYLCILGMANSHSLSALAKFGIFLGSWMLRLTLSSGILLFSFAPSMGKTCLVSSSFQFIADSAPIHSFAFYVTLPSSYFQPIMTWK